MPVELKNMTVDFLSLVQKGANGKTILWKADTTQVPGGERFERALQKVKKSLEKQMVYGIVYSPDQVDSQGEFATAAEIEKAAHGFMKGLKLLNVDAQHDFNPKAAYVAESWLIKGAEPLFQDEPEGAWAVGIKVDDEKLWAQVKKGELAGLSMAGIAQKVKKGETGLLNKLEDLLTRILKGSDEKTKPESEETHEPDVAEIAKALEGLPQIIKSVEGLSARLEKVEKSVPGKSSQGLGDTADEVDGIA